MEKLMRQKSNYWPFMPRALSGKRCEDLVTRYHKRPEAVISEKSRATKY